MLNLELIYKCQATKVLRRELSSDGLEIEGDHLGAIVVVADMDNLGHAETGYHTVDKCD